MNADGARVSHSRGIVQEANGSLPRCASDAPANAPRIPSTRFILHSPPTTIPSDRPFVHPFGLHRNFTDLLEIVVPSDIEPTTELCRGVTFRQPPAGNTIRGAPTSRINRSACTLQHALVILLAKLSFSPHGVHASALSGSRKIQGRRQLANDRGTASAIGKVSAVSGKNSLSRFHGSRGPDWSAFSVSITDTRRDLPQPEQGSICPEKGSRLFRRAVKKLGLAFLA